MGARCPAPAIATPCLGSLPANTIIIYTSNGLLLGRRPRVDRSLNARSRCRSGNRRCGASKAQFKRNWSAKPIAPTAHIRRALLSRARRPPWPLGRRLVLCWAPQRSKSIPWSLRRPLRLARARHPFFHPTSARAPRPMRCSCSLLPLVSACHTSAQSTAVTTAAKTPRPLTSRRGAHCPGLFAPPRALWRCALAPPPARAAAIKRRS